MNKKLNLYITIFMIFSMLISVQAVSATHISSASSDIEWVSSASSDTYTITVTHDGGADNIDEVKIAVPSGFLATACTDVTGWTKSLDGAGAFCSWTANTGSDTFNTNKDFPLTVTASTIEGTHTWNVQTDDTNGQKQYPTFTTGVDTTAPTLTFTDDVENGWVDQEDVTVDSDFDISGKQTFDYVFVADAAVCDATSGWPGTAITDLDTISLTDNSQNNNDFCFRLIDNAGNTVYQKTANIIQVDTTNPIITITDNAFASWATSDTISATMADLESGVDASTVVYGYVDTAAECDATGMASGTTTYTSGISFNVNSDHNDYICFYAEDNAGNTNYQATLQLHVDQSVPTLTFTDDVENGWVDQEDVTVDSDFDISGKQTFDYVFVADAAVCDATSAWPGTVINDLDTVSLTTIAQNNNDFCFKLIDNAGNTAYQRTSNMIQVDPNAPTITITDDASASWVNSETISATMADTESGVDASTVIYGYVDTAAECDATGMASGTFAYTSGTVLTLNSVDHNDFICFYAEDNVGRGTYQATLQLYLDVTAPTMSFTDDVEAGWVTQEDVTVDSDFDISGKQTFDYVFVADAAVCDSTSGWAGTNINDGDTVSLMNNAQNGNDFCFRLIDNANNIAYQRTSNMIQVDTTAPTITITDDASALWVTSDTIAATFVDSPLESDIASMAWKFLPTAGACNAGNMATGATVIGASPWSSIVGSSHIDYICLESIDNVANAAYLSTIQFQVDTTIPNVDVGNDVITNVVYSLDANTDDINATLGLLSGIATWQWSQQSGPGTLTFGTPTAEDTTISADADGIYVIRLTVIDNVGNAQFDELTFIWDTTPPNTNAVETSPTPVRAGSQFTVTATVDEINWANATAKIINESDITVATLTTSIINTNNVVSFTFTDSDFTSGTFIPGNYVVVVVGEDLATNLEVEDDYNKETFEVIEPLEGDPVITSFTISKTSGVEPGEILTATCVATFENDNNSYYEINGIFDANGVMPFVAEMNDGTYTVTCKAIDGVNSRFVTASESYTVGAVNETGAELVTYFATYGTTSINNVKVALDWLNNNFVNYYTITQLNGGQLDNRYYTESELNAGELDTQYVELDDSFSGEVSGAYNNVVLDNNALDDQYIELGDNFGGDVSGVYTNLQLGTNVVGSSEIAANAVKDSEIDYSVVTLADFTDDIGVSADYDTCSDVDTSCMNWTESDITDLDKYTQAEVNTEIDADVLVETNNRIADVDAEELARIADVDSEESARILDVDNEETRATGAENALDTRVLSLEGTDPLDYDSCLDVDTSCMSWTESDITDLDKYTQDEVDDISSDISGLRATSSGIKIQLTKGWTEFRLPAHILTGTNVGNYSGLNVTDYNIETVLDSINGSYNYVAYYDGTQWLVYEDDPTDTFLLFPTVANTPNHVFSIHMTETNTLEIAEK